MNEGMTRKEMITLMSKLFSVLSKAAENHVDYLIKSKQFPELKRGGRVLSAQATTTNRTAITTQKLLQTYNTIQLAWSKQAEFNRWNVSPSLSIQNKGGEDDKKYGISSLLILTKLASWPAKAIYKSLGAQLRKNMRKILPTAIRVLLWCVLDL